MPLIKDDQPRSRSRGLLGMLALLAGVGCALALALFLALMPANRIFAVHVLGTEYGVDRVDAASGIDPMLLNAHHGLQPFTIPSTRAFGLILRFGDQIYVAWRR